jgi:conjugative transfer signal peptidase TraF
MAAGVLLMLLPTPRTRPAIVWNASSSVPLGLYRVEPGPIRRGDLVIIRLPPQIAELAHARGYLRKSAYLIKLVLATAGEQVCRLGVHLLVQGVSVAQALPRDKLGRNMPVWQGCHRLAHGEFFVLADDPDSFDSRYFGVLSERHVVGRAVLLWSVRGPA